MTVEEFKWLIEALVKYGASGLVAAGIFFLLIKHYLGGYLPEKGKNLAAKEDIAKITDLVESVKHDYNVLIKQMESKQQLRMAAVDKRLQAHQEAFTMWRLLFGSDRTLDEKAAVQVARDWWDRNCLYLQPEVRQAFIDTCNHETRRIELNKIAGTSAEANEEFMRLFDFPEILFNAIQLPGLTDSEKRGMAGKPV